MAGGALEGRDSRWPIQRRVGEGRRREAGSSGGEAGDSGRSSRAVACCARLPFWSRAAATAAGFGRKGRSQSGGREAVTWARWAGQRRLELRGRAEDSESRRLPRVTWSRGGPTVGARVEGQSEVLVGSSFVPLGSVRATERKMLNGGCECRVGKCE